MRPSGLAVQQHTAADDCWVVLYGAVYDVTAFLSQHPGGSRVILSLAGSEATDSYDPVHPKGTLEDALSGPDALVKQLGTLDESTLPSQSEAETAHGTSGDEPPMPTLEDCLNMDDIEQLATRKMSKKAWAYYFSGADDLLSKAHNNTVYRSILLRPRVFVDVTHCDPATPLLGMQSSLPIFVSPAAQARLAHDSGEHGIAQACAAHGVCQIISNNASQTPEEICADAAPGQFFGWQLYVQNERAKSEAMLRRINAIPSIKFIVLTLDAPVPGKRELDEKQGRNVGARLPVASAAKQAADSGAKAATSPSWVAQAPADGGGGVGKAMFAGTAPDLTWKTTLPWLVKQTSLPIVLKGIQTHEDAYIASLHPEIKGIILSNHGGRAADTAPPSIHTLVEIKAYCPEVLNKLEVWVDGGIKRGTDVVKALALGAKGVGIGRNALYGLGAGGPEGVERVFELLRAEIETAMRLLGVEKVSELGSQHVGAPLQSLSATSSC